MGRFLAGVASALLLAAAGFFWWQGRVTGGERAVQALSGAPAMAETGTAAPPEAEERTREQKRFDRYDKDRNDGISREEYLANRQKAFARLDTNGDGRLSFDEWAKKTTDKFATADADKSGTLTRAEFATTKVVRKTPVRRDCPPEKPAAEADES